MKESTAPEELIYGQGNASIQLLHANAHVPETYSEFMKSMGHEDYKFHLPIQRPLWPGSDPNSLRHWSLLADDLIAHMDECQRSGVIGIGHSMGAIASWLAAVKRPDLFSQLILIDPVILPEKMVNKVRFVPFWLQKRFVPIVKIASNRRDHWPDIEALENHLGKKKVFQRFDRKVWSDFKKHAVKKVESGITLRYPRAWEAKVYASAPNLWKIMDQAPCKITIIKAEFSDVITPENWAKVKNRMDWAQLIEMPQSGHLVPFEKPSELATLIKEILQ